MPNAPEPDRIREEALEWAHDRLTPDKMPDAFATVQIYVEAFVAGACHALDQRGATR